MFEHQTYHSAPWEYTFGEPELNVQTDFRALPPGQFSRLSGIDWRDIGKLRRFPGFVSTDSLPSTIGGAAYTIGGKNGLSFFRHFSVLAGPYTSSVIRGVVFLGMRNSGGSHDALFVVYSLEGAALSSAVLYELSGTEGFRYVDVATDHQLLLIVGETDGTDSTQTKVERLARFCGTTDDWQTARWNPIPNLTNRPIGLNSFIGTAATDNVNHFLGASKIYGLCYRWVFPDQGYFGPITRPVENVGVKFLAPTGVETSSGAYIVGGNSGTPVLAFPMGTGDYKDTFLGDANVFTRAIIQTFRTTEAFFASQDARGILHFEAEYEIPRVSYVSLGTAPTDYPIQGRTPTFADGSSPWTTLSTGNMAVGTVDGNAVFTGDGARIADVSVGDTIYLLMGPSGTGTESFRDQLTGLVYKRRITAVNIGNRNITWDLPIPRDFSGSARRLSWSVSRAGAEAKTKGLFFTAFANPGGVDTSSHSVNIFWGYNSLVIGMYSGSGTSPQHANVVDTPTGYPDSALTLLPEVEPEEFAILSKGSPRTKLIQEYEGLLVRVTAPSNAENASDHDVVRWDFVDRPRKGLIPGINRRRLPELNDSVVSLIRADPFLAVVLNNSILRLHRSGSNLAVDTIHNQHGAAGRFGTLAIGTNLFLVSPVGILVCDLTSGTVQVINSTAKFFNESGRWAGDLNLVRSAYDATMGAAVWLNPTKKEILALGFNHGIMAHLVDVPFGDVSTGISLTTGNVFPGTLKRAVFLESTSMKLYKMDAFRGGPGKCMTFNQLSGQSFNGVVLTVTNSPNGSITWTTGTYGSAHADMVGHLLRFFDTNGNPKGNAYRVTSQTSSSLTITGAFSPTIAIGDRFSIGGVTLQATMWPLYGDPQTPLLDMLRLKKVFAMGAAVANLSGDVTVPGGGANPNLKLRYQLFGRSETVGEQVAVASSSDTGAEGSLDDDRNDPNFAGVDTQRPVLVPGVECYAANVDFDLLGLIVQGSIEGGRAN